MNLKLALLVLFCLIMQGCMYEVVVPDGKYVSPETRDCIEISGENIKFNLFLKRQSSGAYEYVRDFKFYIQAPVLEILPDIKTPDEYVSGIGQYKWYWINETILKINRWNGEFLDYYKSEESIGDRPSGISRRTINAFIQKRR